MDGLAELKGFDPVCASHVGPQPQPGQPAEEPRALTFAAPQPDGGEFTDPRMFDEVLRARDNERRRIGQELHDSAGQLLVSLQLSISHLKNARDAGDLDATVDDIRETVRQIDTEIRSLSFLSCPAELGHHGLAAALQMLANGFSRRTGIRILFEAGADIAAGSGPAAAALLRVAQEALVNIHRHSRATLARIELRRVGKWLKLLISDNGVGMPPIAGLEELIGVGLRGMRYRIEQVGGRFEIRKVKRGSKIAACVPLES